jgi:hypothetical protein
MGPKSIPPSPAPRRLTITLEQKRALRAHKKQHPQLSNLAIKQWFEDIYKQRISPPSVSEILSKKYDYLDDLNARRLHRKHNYKERWPELEEALFAWVQRAEHEITISGETIRQKAEFFWGKLDVYGGMEMPKFSNGWLFKFQQRRGIHSRVKFGEAASAHDAAIEMDRIRQLLAQFDPSDIFNCDETGLFWKLVPDRSLTTTNIPGRKKQKQRISIHFCTNMDGSVKLPPWIIGTAQNPHVFRRSGIRIQNLGVFWRANKKAWMTALIMEEWLRWFDVQMGLRRRKVALLMDNFSAHEAAISAIQESGCPLQNTFVIWLPPNSTSIYQPLDQGIIRTWKTYWRRDWVRYMLAEYDAGRDALSTINLIYAIRWTVRVWNFDISEKTIANCFSKALSMESRDFEDQSLPTNDIIEGIQQLQDRSLIHDAMNIEDFLNPDGEIVQDDSSAIDDLVLSQIQGPASIEEEDQDDGEGDGEALPQVTVSQALGAIRTARLREEQSESGDIEAIQVLNRLERKYLTEEVNSRHQSDIRSWFR